MEWQYIDNNNIIVSSKREVSETIEISGFDENGKAIKETVILNGIHPVITKKRFLTGKPVNIVVRKSTNRRTRLKGPAKTVYLYLKGLIQK